MSQADLPAARARSATWLNQRERGAVFGIQLVFWLATAFGRYPARQFLRIVAFWYAVFDRSARRASHGFWAHLRGQPGRFRDVYHHILCFARVTLDRIFLLRGATKGFVVRRNGNEHLEALARDRRGAVLMGAHLGSFEAMRVNAAKERFPINIVGHFENARMINALLSRLDPEAGARVLHVGGDPMSFALSVRECLDRGEMVAILADRVGLNDKRTEVSFMGGVAEFPTGPFLLAATLKCPVYLVFGLFFEPNRYELFCEPFADRIVLSRENRAEALREVVQRYAERLEHYVRQAPDNWFNFYDFWKSERP